MLLLLWPQNLTEKEDQSLADSGQSLQSGLFCP